MIANFLNKCFNQSMKNTLSSIQKKFVQKNTQQDQDLNTVKSSNINVLLNRVKQDKKKEIQKKLLFSATVSLGAVLFGVLVF